ncbi:MAG TPA: hypothetical protein VMM77_01705 [Gemmatimonadaceae bacterium]|nr:hypothetical protein [Gemmatimonadaceae bacterium]
MGGFDSHPLPPRAARILRLARLTFVAGAAWLALPSLAVSQAVDSAAVGVRASAARDTTPLRVSPRGAFLRSLAVPGWGQARLDRSTAGAAFVLTETLAAVMIVKSRRQLDLAKAARGDSIFVGYQVGGDGAPVLDQNGAPVLIYEPDPLGARTRSRRQQFEDWVAILAFNHLFSAADAYVAAHLGDIPRRVSMRPTAGGLAISAQLPW